MYDNPASNGPDPASLLIAASAALAGAHSVDEVVDVLRRTARAVVDADGIAVIIRDRDQCHYIAEDAIGPLWRGRRFQSADCISGAAMRSGETIAIADIRVDGRVPQDLYSSTFVRSLAIAPIGQPEPIAALGAYWSDVNAADAATIGRLEGLAKLATVAIQNVRLIEARDRAAALAAAQSDILERIVRNEPLGDTLDAIIAQVERLSTSGVLGSVLLLSEDGETLRHGAGPSLPAAYNEAVDGIAVGPAVGSCGSAIDRGEPVFVTDIATDPLWVDFRDLALAHDLRACWSTPIRSAAGAILGTFAMYHREPRDPAPADLEIVDFVVHTAGLVIERALAQAAARSVEASSRTRERELHFALKAGRFGAWHLDLVSGELTASETCRTNFGRDPGAEFPYSELVTAVHPDDSEAMQAAVAASIATGGDYDIEYRIITPSGEMRWVQIRAQPAYAENGDPIAMTGVSLDITQRRAADDRLREWNDTLESQVAERTAELRFHRDIIEATISPICAFDHDYRLIAFNKAHSDEFFRIFAHRVQIGEVFPDLFPPDQAMVMRGFMARALAGESYMTVEEFGDPDLAKPHWEVIYTPLLDEAGGVMGAFHVANDVSHRLRSESELRATQDALRQAQKMEAMGQLTGGVAHDFNNLLTPIVGSLDMLQRKGIGNEREQRLIAGAMQSAERARTLVQRLLAFARRQPLQAVPVDVATLVAGMGDLVSSTTGPQIRVFVATEPDLPPALADPNQLEMALLNLSVNARDAMPEGGTLRITASARRVDRPNEAAVAPGNYVCLSVADTGIGMDEATLARAVEPFFSTKGVGQGTGLGLSMVHGLASQLGGALVIRSRLGMGTNMELWLPQSAEAATQVDAADHHGPTSFSGRVLLVDDEELVRLSTADMLADLGYDVVEAASGEQALRVLNETPIDLLVTDHLMPGMTGVDLAQEVRRRSPQMPVLLVSGFAEVCGLDAALPRLVKPFRKDELAAIIERVSCPDRSLDASSKNG